MVCDLQPTTIQMHIAKLAIAWMLTACVSTPEAEAIDASPAPDARATDASAPDCAAIGFDPPIFTVSNTVSPADCQARFSVVADGGAASLDDGGVYLCGQRPIDCKGTMAPDAAPLCTYALIGFMSLPYWTESKPKEFVVRVEQLGFTLVDVPNVQAGQGACVTRADASVVSLRLQPLDASSD